MPSPVSAISAEADPVPRGDTRGNGVDLSGLRRQERVPHGELGDVLAGAVLGREVPDNAGYLGAVAVESRRTDTGVPVVVWSLVSGPVAMFTEVVSSPCTSSPWSAAPGVVDPPNSATVTVP